MCLLFDAVDVNSHCLYSKVKPEHLCSCMLLWQLSSEHIEWKKALTVLSVRFRCSQISSTPRGQFLLWNHTHQSHSYLDYPIRNAEFKHFSGTTWFIFYFIIPWGQEVLPKVDGNCFVQKIYITVVNTCILLINAHVSWSSVDLSLLCAPSARTLAWANLKKVFNILTFTVKLVSNLSMTVCRSNKPELVPLQWCSTVFFLHTPYP